MVNFKINVQQVTTIHILPDISRSKGNHTMIFGELIEYNMRNTFLEKSCKKYGAEASVGPFYKNSKLSISLDQPSKSFFLLHLLCPRLGLQKYIKTNVLTTCFYLI